MLLLARGLNYSVMYHKGVVLGPFTFWYIDNIFFSLSDIDICKFVDNKTPFVCDQAFETVLAKL